MAIQRMITSVRSRTGLPRLPVHSSMRELIDSAFMRHSSCRYLHAGHS
jgi:hypothetical protein